MEKDVNENSLIQINRKSIFYKIRMFIINKFKHKNTIPEEPQIERIEDDISNNKQREIFMQSIRNVENDETKLLNLQKQFENYEIKEEDLSQKQIEKLLNLYNKQIEDLEKTNNYRKEKIMNNKYGNKFLEEIQQIESNETRLLKLQKSFEEGKVNEYDLLDNQISSLLELYEDQIKGLEKSNNSRKQKLLKYRNMFKTA